jgi:Predicted ATP-dependent endonuclease of the OLD family
MKELVFRNKEADVRVSSPGNFVIVGANGSGKSHLGAWIERLYPERVLRISAQRALSVPERVSISDYLSSWNEIQYGNPQDLRKGFKWGFNNDEYTTRLVDDYEKTLSAVFSFQNDEEHKFYTDTKAKIGRAEVINVVPERITDRITAIWNEVLPQRQLDFGTAKVEAVYGESKYQAKYMSDGERVALYLISQCLLAPAGMIIIIDEPEIHLHKTIMAHLWDTIERFCQDKVFVYITHDLDFASSRKDAAKIWVQSYKGPETWDLQILPEEEGIPEGLMLEILGNRKPVLFVEGEKTSYDFLLYQQVYADKYVVPAHNCVKVIELTKAFNNERIRDIHHLDVRGLVDRDFMSQNEIDAYAHFGVTTLNVAEVENLYLLEPLLKIVAEHMALNPDETANRVKDYIFHEFQDEQATQLKEMCSRQIAFKLQQFNKPAGDDLQDLKNAISATVGSIDVDNIYAENKQKIDNILNARDYQSLLCIYNRKSLATRVSHFFGLAGNNKYPDFVLKLLKTTNRNRILSALRSAMPQL